MAEGVTSEGAVICAGRVDLDVGAADVFIERALVRERDAGGGNGAPERGGCVDHGRGLLVGDGARERALVDVVVHLAAGPVDGLARDGGIEVAGSGDVLGSAGKGACGSEDEQDERAARHGDVARPSRTAARAGAEVALGTKTPGWERRGHVQTKGFRRFLAVTHARARFWDQRLEKLEIAM